MQNQFPHEFTESVRVLRGESAQALLSALDDPAPVSLRLNPYKIDSPPGGEQVPWCKYGRYLPSRPQFTLDPAFHAGHYYVQEASSMFVGHLFRSALQTTDVSRVLDLCAAPGGKTTLYSTLAGLQSIVVANETVRQRAGILSDNVRKWGLGNVVVTNNDPSHFAPFREWFDVVAVDAPCSGEGMFRKSDEARQQWSENNVRMCAARQRRILADIWDSLRPGGMLLYSTCTFNRTENEENVEWLAATYDCEDPGIEIPSDWGIEQTEAAGIKCFRFYPDRIKGEGFFACAIRKSGQRGRLVYPKPRRAIFADVAKGVAGELTRWLGQPEFMRLARIADNHYAYYEPAFRDIRAISESMNAIHSGIEMGQIFGRTLRPDHSLALFHDLNRDNLNRAEVSVQDAVRYLQKEELADLSPLAEGINLITCGGAALGWAKRIGNRANNLYPKSLMINGR